MPLLALLIAASLALILAASVLFNAPPQSRQKNALRASAKANSDSEISYRQTVGF
jgi:type II secretory pathway pseudopilin PulG